MSRVGLLPVEVPEGVDLQVKTKEINAKGKLGELSMTIVDEIEISHEGNNLWVKPVTDSKRARTMWGTTRSLLDNLITGVSRGFEKKLSITGVGYRAQLQGTTLVLQLGYSHDIRYAIPEGINIELPSQAEIVVSGADKQKVGQVAAEIRSFRKPEPYKGKGVRYTDEIILRKEGKKK